MVDPRWEAVDRYFADRVIVPDDALDAALRAGVEAGLPVQQISPLQGQFLMLLARSINARRILEVGTLAGYSGIWLGRALPPDGRLVTLEASTKHAAVARANFDRAGLGDSVEVRLGRALDTLPKLAAEGAGPFDLFFIDADKPSNPDYVRWALRLARPGSLIVVDNVVRGGHVTEAASESANVKGVRAMVDLLANEPGVIATAVQTVGSKGYDGFVVALVAGRPEQVQSA